MEAAPPLTIAEGPWSGSRAALERVPARQILKPSSPHCQRRRSRNCLFPGLDLEVKFKVIFSCAEVNQVMMNIGQLAALAGVPTATVRYYERRGLIAQAPRTVAGYRQYGPDTAKRLRFIKRAQELGFSLDGIGELLALRVDDPAACPRVEAKTREKIAQVERMIGELSRMHQVLEGLAASCRTRVPTAECPILEALLEEDANA